MDCDDWSKMEFCFLDDYISPVACVYFLMNDNELKYIGQTNNLKNRISQHNETFNENIMLGGKLINPRNFNSVYYFVDWNKHSRIKLEREYINMYSPKWNCSGMFSKISMMAVHPYLRPWNYKKH